MGTRFTILLILFLGCAGDLGAGQYFSKHLRGKIDADSVSLFLTSSDTVLTGYYAYNALPDVFYYIKGSTTESGVLQFSVSDSSNLLLAECSGKMKDGNFSASSSSDDKSKWNFIFVERSPEEGKINFSYAMHREKKSCAKLPDSCYVYRCQYFLPDGGMNDAAKASMLEDLAVTAFGVSAKPVSGKPPRSYTDLIASDANAFFESAMKSPKPQKKEKYVLVRNQFHQVLTMLCVQRSINPISGWTMQTYFRNYDIKTGDTIPLKSLFKKGFEKALSDSLRMEVCRLYDVSPTDQLTIAGFKSNTIPLNTNFYITENSIGFYFNPGEISTDNVPAQITLRPAAIRNIIDPKGPIGWMIKP